MRQPASAVDDVDEFVGEVSSTIAGLQQLLNADAGSADAEPLLTAPGIDALANVAVGLLRAIRVHVPPHLRPGLFAQLLAFMDGLLIEAEREGFGLDHDGTSEKCRDRG